LAWQIELTTTAEKQLSKLDKVTAKRITQFLRQRIALANNPRTIGKPLAGSRRGLWRYRVGDYRLICELQDERLVVLVVEVGHRGEIYR